MANVSEYFEEIHLGDSRLSEPKIDGSTLIVCARNVVLTRRHPAFVAGKNTINSAHLIFEGVRSSKREVYEYTGDSLNASFHPPRTIDDGPFPEGNLVARRFLLEGVLEKPFGWVRWTIEATTFHLDIL